MTIRQPKVYKKKLGSFMLEEGMRQFVFTVTSCGPGVSEKVISVVKSEYASALVDGFGTDYLGCFSSGGYNYRQKAMEYVFSFKCTESNCGKIVKVIIKEKDVLLTEGDLLCQVEEEDREALTLAAI
jgi:hypothetical protein